MWRQHGEVVKDREARARMASFPRCVTLGKFLKLPEPLFPHLENGVVTLSKAQACCY